MTAGSEANAEPHAHRHDTVVDDVQQRDVLLFLTQHEEELHDRPDNPTDTMAPLMSAQ